MKSSLRLSIALTIISFANANWEFCEEFCYYNTDDYKSFTDCRRNFCSGPDGRGSNGIDEVKNTKSLRLRGSSTSLVEDMSANANDCFSNCLRTSVDYYNFNKCLSKCPGYEVYEYDDDYFYASEVVNE